MFHFFTKKTFLIDYLDGFVDMHNHILPGIDDGAKTVEESVALIKGFLEFGVNSFICTPHIMNNYYPNTPETIESSLILLKNKLQMQNLENISISTAAEHMIDDNFETILEGKKVMPLGGNYLLIEMSYLQPSINFNEAVQQIAAAKYFPILAHPERYVFISQGSTKYKKYKADGILFQLNLLSLSDFYGKEVQKKALHLLENNLIDFVATDTHNMRQLTALKEIKLSNKSVQLILPILDRTKQSF